MAIDTQLKIVVSAQNNAAAAILGLQKDLDGLKAKVLQVGAAIGGALALKDVIASTNKWAQETHDLQSELGISAQAASRLNFIGQELGISTDELTTSMGRLAKNMFSNSVEADRGKDAFSKWGIAVKAADGSTKNIIDVLEMASDRVRQLGDGAAARALEMDIFGKSGGRLHDLLMEGADGVRQLTQESDALGLTLTDKMQAALYASVRAQRTFNLALEGLKVQLGAAITPLLTTVILSLTRLFAWINANILQSRVFTGVLKILGEAFRIGTGWLKELMDKLAGLASHLDDQLFGGLITLKGLLLGIAAIVIAEKILSLATAIFTLGAALAPIGALAFGLAVVYQMGSRVFDTVGPVTLLRDALIGLGLGLLLIGSPAAIVVGAVALVGAAIIEVGQTIVFFIENWDKFVYALQHGELNNIPVFGAFFNAAQHVMESIGSIRAAWEDLQRILSGQSAFQRTPVGPAGPEGPGGPVNTPKGPLPIIRPIGFASGGIVTSPTFAMIGESGPEAVIPLGGGGAGNTYITVNVSGNITENEQDLADRVGDSIMRQLTHSRSVSF